MSLAHVAALFGAGVASFLAPCVIPLMPAYLGMLGGSVTERGAGLVRSTLGFVTGFTAVFVALGVLAGALGSALTGATRTVEVVGGAVIVMLGATMLAGRWMRTWQPLARATPMAPFAMGVAFGAAWTPCVGPLLAAALVVAADSHTAAQGGLLLAAYSAGIGLPFVALSAAAGSVSGFIERWQRVAPRVEKLAGATMVVLGGLLLAGGYDDLIARLG